jgi:hypothetical protein
MVDINNFTSETKAKTIKLQYFCDTENIHMYGLWSAYGVLRIDGKLKELVVYRIDSGVDFDPTDAMEQKKQIFGAEEVIVEQLDVMPEYLTKEDFDSFFEQLRNKFINT